MSLKKTPITPAQLRRLADDIKALPNQPEGDHPTDEELVAYAMESSELDSDKMRTMDAHFASCEKCAAEIQRLLDVSEAWRGPAGKARLASLSQRIRSTVRTKVMPPAASLAALAGAQTIRYPAALPMAAGAPLNLPLERSHVVITDDSDLNLHVAVSSYEVLLEGTRVIVEPFGVSFVLEAVPPDQVGGEVTIPREARVTLPKGTQVSLRFERGGA